MCSEESGFVSSIVRLVLKSNIVNGFLHSDLGQHTSMNTMC